MIKTIYDRAQIMRARQSVQITNVRITYLRQIADQAIELGIDLVSWLATSGLKEKDLVDATLLIPIEKFGNLVSAAITQSGESGFGVLAGCRLIPSSHGIVGMAAGASHSIREAMQIVERYVCIRTGVIDIRTRVVNGMFEVLFEPVLGLGAAANAVTEIAMVAVKNIADDLVQHGSACSGACFSFPEPPHASMARDIFGCQVQYGQASSSLFFSLSAVEKNAPKYDPLVLAESVRLCTDEFKNFRNNKSTSSKLAGVILECSPAFPTLKNCAHLLGMTPRTLHRRLIYEGTSYREVAESVRHHMALELLRKKMSVKEVTYLLGYTDMANFRRAFKRWEDIAPSAWLSRVQNERKTFNDD